MIFLLKKKKNVFAGATDARDAVQLLYRFLSSSSSVINSTDVELVVESPRVRFTMSNNPLNDNLVCT